MTTKSIAGELNSILHKLESIAAELESFKHSNIYKLEDMAIGETVNRGLIELEKSVSTLNELF